VEAQVTLVLDFLAGCLSHLCAWSKDGRTHFQPCRHPPVFQRSWSEYKCINALKARVLRCSRNSNLWLACICDATSKRATCSRQLMFSTFSCTAPLDDLSPWIEFLTGKFGPNLVLLPPNPKQAIALFLRSHLASLFSLSARYKTRGGPASEVRGGLF